MIFYIAPLVMYLCAFGVSADDKAICNAVTDSERAWIRSMYDSGLAAGLAGIDANKYTVAKCKRFLVESKEYDIFWDENDKTECGSAVSGAAIAAWIFYPLLVVGALAPLCMPLINRDTYRCRIVLKRERNRELGVNLVLPWPDNLDFITRGQQSVQGAGMQVVHIQQGVGQSHQFTPFFGGKKTHWAEVTLQKPDTLPHPIYRIQFDNDALYRAPLQFGSKGFRGFEDDIAFTSAVKLSKNASGMTGVTTNGCNPPSFVFSVSFVQTSEVPNNVADDMYGSMLSKFSGNPIIDKGISDTNSKRRRLLSMPSDNVNVSDGISRNRQLQSVKRPCYRRVVQLVQVVDQADSNFMCEMEFSTLSIRKSMMSPVTQTKADLLKTTPAALVKEALVREARYATCTEHLDKFVAVSPAYAEQVVGCAMSLVNPGFWRMDAALNEPGGCVLCRATAKPNSVTVRCGYNDVTDCCDVCIDGYVSISDRCVRKCKLRTQAYTLPGIAVCMPCGVGTVQNVTSGLNCAPCSAFDGNGPNSVVEAGTGLCIKCGMMRYADAATFTRCLPCPENEWVPDGKTSCERCPAGSVLRPTTGTGVYACVYCAAGTYQDDNECLMCPVHHISARNGSATCLPCNSSFSTVGRDRTACVPCTPLDNSSSLVEYAPGVGQGCSKRCVAGAYAKTTAGAYIAGGCVSCATRTVTVGSYPDASDCTILRRCTNAPSSLGAVYTSAGKNATGCAWGCAAGYYLAGSSCVVCTVSDSTPAYNSSIHMYLGGTNQCQVGCKATLYSTGSSCLPCHDLYPTNNAAIVASRVFARVRLYNNVSYRAPLWIPGKCGTDAVVLSAAPIFIQRTARYVYYGGEQRLCGDGLLQAGEECDDGNTDAMDGCSPSCMLYPYSGYDCDLIGEACKRNCGWEDADVQSLGWYILPNASSCVGISYYDYRHTSGGARLAWLRDHMVSCICTTSIYAQLPRQLCTAQNKGCRTCNTSQYHEDMGLSRCVECGSVCPAGYIRDPARRKCGPSVRTAELSGLSDDERYLRVGCIPCVLPNDTSTYAVSYIEGCRYSCRGVGAQSDVSNPLDFCSTVESLMANNLCRGYYCKGLVSLDDGACAGSCHKCTCPDSTGTCMDTNQLSVGQYWGTCSTGVGIVATACDPSYLPGNASFTSAATYGMSRGCQWACDTGYALNSFGKCVKCTSSQHQCADGQIPKLCDTTSELYFCLDCHANTMNQYLLRPFETWKTVDRQCVPTCAPGAWLQTDFDAAGVCVPCTLSVCGLGQYQIPCNATADAACVACPNPLSANTEYVAAGVCEQRCVAGYYRANEPTTPYVMCAVCSKPCSHGQYQTLCDAPSDRLSAPTCLACPPLQNGTTFFRAGDCKTTMCLSGWKRVDSVCVPCNSTQCLPGSTAVCEGDVQTCETCPAIGNLGRQLPLNEEYHVHGSCVSRCRTNTARATPNAACLPMGAPLDGTEPANSTPPPSDVAYPSRVFPHSNGSVFFDWLQP